MKWLWQVNNTGNVSVSDSDKSSGNASTGCSGSLGSSATWSGSSSLSNINSCSGPINRKWC